MTDLQTSDLLVEIGTEEIPARFLCSAQEQFLHALLDQLKANAISVAFEKGSSEKLFTPRRLAVFIPGIPVCQDDRTEQIKGPPAKIAYHADGTLTDVAKAFAAKHRVKTSQLVKLSTPKGEYLFVSRLIKGVPTEKVLPDILCSVIEGLRFPKTMRWGPGGMRFARPIRWLMAVFGEKPIRVKLRSLSSGKISRGHRVLSNKTLMIGKADRSLYKDLLREHGVVVDFDERRYLIQEKILQILGKNRRILDEDQALLDEVTNLVEWPEVALGSFDPRMLSLPEEILVTAMRHHQRYFAVFEQNDGPIKPEFLLVYNGAKQMEDQVVKGNERVLRARLADAAFFWNEDSKKSLSEQVPLLKHVLFQESLGSYFDKTQRLVRLAHKVSENLKLTQQDRDHLERACHLSKADLVSEMVKEHPVLQGIMGRVYARKSGEEAAVCVAIGEQYLPVTGSDGVLPESQIGAILALIDKMDTLTGCFHAGLEPTGSQDPYGLKRGGQGLLRILYEKSFALDLDTLVKDTVEGYGLCDDGLCKRILAFLKERLQQLFLSREFPHDMIKAVLETQYRYPSKAFDILCALNGIKEKSYLKEAITVVERTFNISKHAALADLRIDETLLQQEEEIALYRSYQSHYDEFLRLAGQRQYREATQLYSQVFAIPTHAFFDKVLVNVEETGLKNNRLALCQSIYQLYAKEIADLSKLVLK
ncbi:MAG: glycine--tRNA ligase subunit beta [Chlamydiota bacterium]|nr:glycine--tRNA ligase subunit beta [Chlamydiota bacterium]